MFLSGSKSSDFEKVRHDISFLITCFGEVLDQIGEHELSRMLPWQDGQQLSPHNNLSDPVKLIQAYSIVFQLLNIVEENAVVQYRRQLEKEGSAATFSGAWEQNLGVIRALKQSPEEIAAVLGRITVEPTLTAHPTEAKRYTVLEQHRRLYLHMVDLENQMWTPEEKSHIRNSIKADLERLWRTGEIYIEKPDVASEIRNVMYYFRDVFPRAIPYLDRHLVQAWVKAGFSSDLLRDPRHLPNLSFGTWVGGDRDGHPLVTAETTQSTLGALRSAALELLGHELQKLAQRMSLSSHTNVPPSDFSSRIAEVAETVGQRGQLAVARNPNEPWRQWVNLMVARLPTGDTREAVFRSPEELETDLSTLSESLVAVGAGQLAVEDVFPVIRLVRTFGFHLASLDIRQNSAYHDRAIQHLLVAGGYREANFAEWDEHKRVAFLSAELAIPRTLTIPHAPLGAEALDVLSTYRVIGDYVAQYGSRGIGSLIVSMTRNVSDLLAVYLLAREAGLCSLDPAGRLVCPIPVVPLFETIEDLERAPGVLSSFLEHPMTIASHQHRYGDCPSQLVMVGYSDSNKDGGLAASIYHLHQAQAALKEVGDSHGVQVRFFHGRGGSISRGASPVHRFVRSLPTGTVKGFLRITEQGEVIASKYANLRTAVHNLEMLLSETFAATTRPVGEENSLSPELSGALAFVADESRKTYRALITDESFMTFYRQATPIDVIESSRIGSRPSRRTGKHTLADLRAIPWVFSWTQSRFLLSGWYGLGSALSALRLRHPNLFDAIREHALNVPLVHTVMSNAASSLMLADRGIMQLYASLVEDQAIRDRFMQCIVSEMEKTRELLEVIYGGTLVEKRPNAALALSLRSAPLAELHQMQVSLLRQWRVDPRDELLRVLLMTVNGVANGLGATG